MKIKWSPLEILDFRRFKEVIILYGIHSPYAKHVSNSWATMNRIFPQNLKELTRAILEDSPHLKG